MAGMRWEMLKGCTENVYMAACEMSAGRIEDALFVLWRKLCGGTT